MTTIERSVELGCHPATRVDIVRAIGVLGPFLTEKRLRAARPEFLIRSILELPDILKRLLA